MEGKDMATISNEGLAIEIKNIGLQISDLKTLMATQAANYVHKEVFELRIKELETKQDGIRLELEKVRKETSKANWKSHTLTATFTATLVFLASYFLNNIIK